MEIGIIDDKRIRILINWIGTYVHYVFCKTRSIVVSPAMIKNKTFDKKFISPSKIPTFVLGELAPIATRVYLPT